MCPTYKSFITTNKNPGSLSFWGSDIKSIRQGMRYGYLHSVSFVLLAFAFTSFSFVPPIRYVINEQSAVYLEGSTNINRFACNSLQGFSPATIDMQTDENNYSLQFRNASIELAVQRMDCGNKGMNRDMQKALQSDQYPTIQIELKEVEMDTASRGIKASQWTSILAHTRITIAGNSRPISINLYGIALEPNQYQFKGSKSLRMTDFGIDPPNALLGLVQVDDIISIHFDLLIEKW